MVWRGYGNGRLLTAQRIASTIWRLFYQIGLPMSMSQKVFHTVMGIGGQQLLGLGRVVLVNFKQVLVL